MSQDPIVIVSAARTAMGSFQGGFASLTAAISIEKKGVRESMPDLAVVHHSLNSYERNLTQYFEE